MRTVAVIEPGKVELVEIKEPKPGPYQVRVKTEVACLCNATDGKLIAGKFPGVEEYPLVLGHESAGIVADVGEKVRNLKVGDRVIGGLVFDFAEREYSTGWGGFCEYTLVCDHDAMIADGVADEDHGWVEVFEIQRKVPADIPVDAAVLLCTWREVYGGFGDFNLKAGDSIIVFGAGPVGLSFLKFGKLLGLGFIGVVDPLENKREKALSMGADEVFSPESPKLKNVVQRRGGPLDAVIDAVGLSSIINMALPMIKLGGSICVYGVIGESEITVSKGSGPLNFNLYMHQWPTRSRERAAQKPLCDWIRQGKLKSDDFITNTFKIEEINDAIEAVKDGSVIKAILRY